MAPMATRKALNCSFSPPFVAMLPVVQPASQGHRCEARLLPSLPSVITSPEMAESSQNQTPMVEGRQPRIYKVRRRFGASSSSTCSSPSPLLLVGSTARKPYWNSTKWDWTLSASTSSIYSGNRQIGPKLKYADVLRSTILLTVGIRRGMLRSPESYWPTVVYFCYWNIFGGKHGGERESV